LTVTIIGKAAKGSNRNNKKAASHEDNSTGLSRTNFERRENLGFAERFGERSQGVDGF
jgi:hypothetical protein